MTKTDNIYETKKLIGFSIGPTVNVFIGLISVPITTRFLVPEEFGRATFYSTVLGIVMAIISLSLPQAFNRFYGEDDDTAKLLRHTLIIPLSMWLLLSIIIYLFRHFFLRSIFSSNDFFLIYCMIGQLFFQLINTFGRASIRMENKAGLFSLITIVRRIISFASTVLLLLFWVKSFKAIILASLLTEGLDFIILFFLKYRKWKLFGKINSKYLMQLVKFSLPLLGTALIGWIYQATDKTILKYFVNYESIGLYSGANKIVQLLSVFVTSIRNYWLPASLNWYRKGNQQNRISTTSQLFSIIIVIAGLIIIIGKNLLIKYLGNDYYESQQYLPFLLAVPIISIISGTAGVGLLFSNQTHLIMRINIITTLSNLILNLLLVFKFGALGCVIATALSSFINLILEAAYCKKVKHYYYTKNHYFLVLVFLICAFSTLLPNNNYIWICSLSIIIIICIDRKLIKKTIIILINLLKDITTKNR